MIIIEGRSGCESEHEGGRSDDDASQWIFEDQTSVQFKSIVASCISPTDTPSIPLDRSLSYCWRNQPEEEE